MFIFFTVLLLLWVISLWKIDSVKMMSQLRDSIINIYKINKDDVTIDSQLSVIWVGIKLCSYCLFALSYIFVFVIYLLNAISVDVYKYPTYAMIGLFLFGILKNMFKKKSPKIRDNMSEELKNEILNNSVQESIDKSNKLSFKIRKYIVRTYTVCYYLYMLYVLTVM